MPEFMNHSNFGRSPHVPLLSLKPSYAESTRLSATGNKRCWEHKKSTAWNVQCAAESSELRSPRCRRVDAREAEGLVDGRRRILDRKRHLSEWVVGPDGKPDDDYKAAVEPRFVQWVVDTFQLSIKRARLSGRNCLTTYPGEEKHDRCSRVDSSSVAALFPERLSGLVAAGRLCYCRLPNQDAL